MFHRDVTWKTILAQPTAWYKSPEAQKIAQMVLLYQHPNGGWEKNLDMIQPPKTPPKETTIDNGATTTQLMFLARVRTPECQTAALKAIDFLLAAQYPNGGWPQFWPLKKGYYTHITFNDDAMARVLTVLREIAQNTPDYAFVDGARRQKCAGAVTKGIACILKCQVVLQGKKTLWCAQHDEVTFAPAKARAYELPSLSGSESVDILRFIMGEKLTPTLVDAIEGGIAWLKANQLTGIRVEKQGDDKVVVRDPSAPPTWARFYDLETGKPFFCGRDGIKKSSMAEIEKERRTGYSWYTNRGNQLLSEDYLAWQKKARRELLLTGLGLAIAPSPSEPPTLWLIGDSTVKNNTKGQQGWGTALPPLFDTTKLKVVNKALGGRSSRTFLTEGLWDAVAKELKKGDMVVMQFGHNDGGDRFRGTRPRASLKGNGDDTETGVVEATGKEEIVHSYGWYLRKYITEAKAKGATAVVCSPIPRNIWKDGKVGRAADDYGKWAKEAATQERVHFLDLNTLIADRYEQLGEEKVAALFFGDHTHTSPDGAALNASIVAEGLKKLLKL